jgi:serine-type D-Ala-D-Ala carboxypeptidase
MERREFMRRAALAALTAYASPARLLAANKTEEVIVRDDGLCRENFESHGKWFEELIASGLTPNVQVMLLAGDRVVFDFCGGTEGPTDTAPRKVTPDLLFNIGSVTKPVVALLVVRLADMGRLAVTDPVAKWVKDYPYADHQVIHLLTHTAGYSPAQTVAWPTDDATFVEYRKKIYACRPIENKPGDKMAYYSSGYLVLKEVVENASGADIETFARRELLDPLGMSRTTFVHTRFSLEQHIVPFDKDGNRFQTETAKAPPIGETGLKSTCGDMARLCALINGGGSAAGKRILGPDAMKLVMTDQTAGFLRTAALWMRGKGANPAPFGSKDSPETVGHPGYSGCMISHDPATKLSMALVTNSLRLHGDFANYTRIKDKLAAMRTG